MPHTSENIKFLKAGPKTSFTLVRREYPLQALSSGVHYSESQRLCGTSINCDMTRFAGGFTLFIGRILQ